MSGAREALSEADRPDSCQWSESEQVELEQEGQIHSERSLGSGGSFERGRSAEPWRIEDGKLSLLSQRLGWSSPSVRSTSNRICLKPDEHGLTGALIHLGTFSAHTGPKTSMATSSQPPSQERTLSACDGCRMSLYYPCHHFRSLTCDRCKETEVFRRAYRMFTMPLREKHLSLLAQKDYGKTKEAAT